MSRFSKMIKSGTGGTPWMSHKVSRREIDRIVDHLDIVPAEEYDVADAQEVRVAAVQLLCKRYESLVDYIIDMNLYVSDAVNRRARLVCFPELCGLLPAGMLPKIEPILQRLRPETPGLPDPFKLGEFLSEYSDTIFDAYFHTMSALAARHRVYIMAGSALYFDEDEPRHRAFLFSETGDLAGYQDKLGLNDLEMELGIEATDEIKVFDSHIGPVAIVIGSDAEYFEITRTAHALGARILLHPRVLEGEYTPLRMSLGLNMRVQETRMLGVQSVLVGDTGLGFPAEGCCCLFGPAELSRARNGVIARSSGRFEPDILCESLSLERLSKVRNPYKLDRNVEFMEKYLDRLY